MNKVLTIAFLSAFGFVAMGAATAQAGSKDNKDSHHSNNHYNDRHNDHKDCRHDDCKKDKDCDHDKYCDHDRDCGHGPIIIDPLPPKHGPIWGGNPPRKPEPVVNPVWGNRPVTQYPFPKAPVKLANPILAGKLSNAQLVAKGRPVHNAPKGNGQIPNIGTGWNGFAGAVGGEVGSIVTGTLKGVGDVAGGVAKGVGDVLGGVADGVGDVLGGIF